MPRGCPTVITTTAQINEIDARLQSRMLDTSRCTFFVITAPSFRGSDVAARRRRTEAASREASAHAREGAVRPRAAGPISTLADTPKTHPSNLTFFAELG